VRTPVGGGAPSHTSSTNSSAETARFARTSSTANSARCRGAQFVVGRIRLADAQVLRDRPVEQQRLLEHDADIVTQARER